MLRTHTPTQDIIGVGIVCKYVICVRDEEGCEVNPSKAHSFYK